MKIMKKLMTSVTIGNKPLIIYRSQISIVRKK